MRRQGPRSPEPLHPEMALALRSVLCDYASVERRPPDQGRGGRRAVQQWAVTGRRGSGPLPEERYDELPDGALVAGPAGRVPGLNRAAARLLGVSLADVLGRDYRDVLPLRDAGGA